MRFFLLMLVPLTFTCGEAQTFWDQLTKVPTGNTSSALKGMFSSLSATADTLLRLDNTDVRLSDCGVTLRDALAKLSAIGGSVTEMSTFLPTISNSFDKFRNQIVVAHSNTNGSASQTYEIPPKAIEFIPEISDNLVSILNRFEKDNQQVQQFVQSCKLTKQQNFHSIVKHKSLIDGEMQVIMPLATLLNNSYENCTEIIVVNEWGGFEQLAFCNDTNTEATEYTDRVRQQLQLSKNLVSDHQSEIIQMTGDNNILESTLKWFSNANWASSVEYVRLLINQTNNLHDQSKRFLDLIRLPQPFAATRHLQERKSKVANLLAFCNYFPAVSSAVAFDFRYKLSPLILDINDLLGDDSEAILATQRKLIAHKRAKKFKSAAKQTSDRYLAAGQGILVGYRNNFRLSDCCV